MRPGTWQRIRTNDGWHIRLVAPNGEVIVWSENYKNKRDTDHAFYLITESMPDEYFSSEGHDFHEVDLRVKAKEGEKPKFWRAHCRDCTWETWQEDYTQRANYVGQHRLQTAHRVAMSLDKE